MGRVFSSVGLLLLMQLGCGGVADRSDIRPSSSVGGATGSSTDPGAGARAGGTPVGAAGEPSLIIPVEDGGASEPPRVPEGTTCGFPPPSCGVRGQQIRIVGLRGEITVLSYPLDTSCGECVDVDCREDCPIELTCSLWARGEAACGNLSLRLAACSGLNGQGACLNTASDLPYYTDGSGKRWPHVTLTGNPNQPGASAIDGTVAVELELTISDGVTTQIFGVHADLCADISYPLSPC